MGSLSKLLLHLFVDLDLTLVSLDLRLHLVVLEDEDLRLLRLMLKFSGQLMVLQNGQVRRSLQLLVVHGEQVCLGLFDVKEHLLSQLFCLLDAIELLLVDLLKAQGFLSFEKLLQVDHFVLHLLLLLQEGIRFALLGAHVSNLV